MSIINRIKAAYRTYKDYPQFIIDNPPKYGKREFNKYKFQRKLMDQSVGFLARPNISEAPRDVDYKLAGTIDQRKLSDKAHQAAQDHPETGGK